MHRYNEREHLESKGYRARWRNDSSNRYTKIDDCTKKTGLDRCTRYVDRCESSDDDQEDCHNRYDYRYTNGNNSTTNITKQPENKDTNTDTSKQIINYIIVDESKVDEQMICPVSQNIMINPVTTKCNHTFDKKMIEPWLQEHKTCPLCRSGVLLSDLKENIELCERMAMLSFKVNQNDVDKIIAKCKKQKIEVPENLKDNQTIDFSLFRKINM
jgi:hypothetical protein